MNTKRRSSQFAPQVSGLERREVPAHLLAKPVVAIHAANNSGTLVQPLRLLAGQWNSVFHATVDGANYLPGLPAHSTCTVETKLSGNKLDTSITGGTIPNGWSYSISGDKNGKLTYSMTDPFNPSVVLNAPGKRIGVGAWAFDANLNGPGGQQQMRVVFSIVNRDHYAVMTSVKTTEGYMALYFVSNSRINPS